jgi:hypothetical protein
MLGVETESRIDTARGPAQTRCPLCGGDNACQIAQGKSSCWCFSIEVPAEVRERVPPALEGVACICERCAASTTRAE